MKECRFDYIVDYGYDALMCSELIIDTLTRLMRFMSHVSCLLSHVSCLMSHVDVDKILYEIVAGRCETALL